MAHCDLITGEIFDCKEGSKEWWHEKGHLAFYKSGQGSRMQLLQNHMLLFWVGAVSLAFLNKYMLYLVFPLAAAYIGIYLFEEYWCNNFAKLMMEKENDSTKPQNIYKS